MSEHTPHELLNPKHWKAPKGYANAVAARGRMIFLGGQIGWTGDQVFETDDFVGQCEQALSNIRAVVEAAGGAPEHIVRLTWFVTDKAEYLARQKEMGEAYRRVMGRHFPAMSMLVVAGLIEDRAKVEIEATAEIPEAASA